MSASDIAIVVVERRRGRAKRIRARLSAAARFLCTKCCASTVDRKTAQDAQLCRLARAHRQLNAPNFYTPRALRTLTEKPDRNFTQNSCVDKLSFGFTGQDDAAIRRGLYDGPLTEVNCDRLLCIAGRSPKRLPFGAQGHWIRRVWEVEPLLGRLDEGFILHDEPQAIDTADESTSNTD